MQTPATAPTRNRIPLRHLCSATLLLTLALAGSPVLAQPRPAAARTPASAASGASAPAAPASSGQGFSREKKEDVCTLAPRSEWLPEEEMRLLAVHRGYRIRTFKVANNSCYEIYGFDRSGQIVEAYFDPVTSRLVRQNIAR